MESMGEKRVITGRDWRKSMREPRRVRRVDFVSLRESFRIKHLRPFKPALGLKQASDRLFQVCWPDKIRWI
jgi:hypothetical protein